MKNDIEKLIETLQGLGAPPSEIKAVLMPDFFLDHLVTYKGTLDSFKTDVTRIAEQGGGNIPDTKQTIQRGGNSANTASALSTLGISSYIISRTSPLGLFLLQHFLGNNVNLSHVKTDGKMALTTVLELEYDQRKVNVMLGDPGSVCDFSFNSLTEDDLQLIKEADYVCVFNWNLNLHGTELASKVFELVKKEGKGRTFFDTGDPSPRQGEINSLVEKVLRTRTIDVISLNENEALWYASYFDERIKERRKNMRPVDLAIECARILRDNLRTRIDLHTAKYTATFGQKECIVQTFAIPIQRVTGAGDAWNATDIYGEIMRLDDAQRLLFANAAAAYYISNPEGKHPTRTSVINFLKTQIELC